MRLYCQETLYLINYNIYLYLDQLKAIKENEKLKKNI